MEKKSFESMPCAIARGLEAVGEWWSILILRDIMRGLTKFDEFQGSLGIPPTTLTKRLAKLAESGLIERRQYNLKPPRFEYVLTESGRDFLPVLAAILAWGSRHASPEGVDTWLLDSRSKQRLDPVVVDRATGELITMQNSQLYSTAADEKSGASKRPAAKRK